MKWNSTVLTVEQCKCGKANVENHVKPWRSSLVLFGGSIVNFTEKKHTVPAIYRRPADRPDRQAALHCKFINQAGRYVKSPEIDRAGRQIDFLNVSKAPNYP